MYPKNIILLSNVTECKAPRRNFERVAIKWIHKTYYRHVQFFLPLAHRFQLVANFESVSTNSIAKVDHIHFIFMAIVNKLTLYQLYGIRIIAALRSNHENI